MLACLSGCENPSKLKIGISFGVGEAQRWPMEMEVMVARAQELGMEVEARLNKTDTPKTQVQDCIEMIDSGIAVLILTPRDVRKTDKILEYAKKKKVKVLSYARAVVGENFDLFVGYDTYRIGQTQGLYLAEKTFHGSIAILKGDENDFNSSLMYDGTMKYLRPLAEEGSLKIIQDEFISGWSGERARAMLTDSIIKNNYKIDAVLAQSDVFAGVAADVIKELKIKNHVVIVGMDAELTALKRMVAGTQDATIHMDLKNLAQTAVNEAYNMATQRKPNINSQFNNKSVFQINAYLINGKLVTRESIDRVIIQPGVFTRAAIYDN